MKRITTLAAATALIALAVPATASATWTHNHQTLGVHADIQYTGQFAYQGEVGKVECQVTSNMQLTKGTTTGHLQSIFVDVQGIETVTDNCQVTGGTASLGCTDVASMTTSGYPWGIHAINKKTISITTGTIQFHLHGGIFCPKTKQLTPGTIHLNMTTENTWAGGQTSGTLNVHSSGGESAVTITGTGNISPAGTYGVVA